MKERGKGASELFFSPLWHGGRLLRGRGGEKRKKGEKRRWRRRDKKGGDHQSTNAEWEEEKGGERKKIPRGGRMIYLPFFSI